MIDKKLFELLPENKKQIMNTVLYKIVSLVCSIAILLGIKIAVDQKISNLITWIILLLVFVIIKIIFIYLAQDEIIQTSNNTKAHLRKLLYEKLLRIGTSFQGKVDSSNISQLLTEGVDQLEVYFALYLPQFFYAMISPVILFIVLSFISLKVALVLLVMVPLIPISIVLVQKFAKRILNKYWSSYLNLGSSFLDSLQGLSTLKSFQIDDVMHQKINEESESFRKATMRVLIMQLNSISVMDLVAYGGAMLAIVLAYLEYNKASITMGSFVFLVLVSSEFFIPMRQLGSYFHIAMNGAAASDKIFSFLNLEEDAKKDETIESVASIQVEKLHYAYGEREVLSNINFMMNSPSKFAFVGESGSGKSTLLSLVARQLQSSNIKMNGIQIKKLNTQNFYDHVQLVSSKSEVFKGTIRSNLELSGVSDESKLLKVLEDVSLINYLENNQGLDSVVLERGSNLSGGERQRLILARALLKDVDVYLFDEVTSSIDAESEAIILNVINNLDNKFIMMVSHRLRAVQNFDNILVLDSGVIIEQGNHETLQEKKGKYHSLFTTQERLELKYEEA